ncbi:MAG: aminopeptidase P N-terminal domain-containing protein, partial [Bacteroidales bacterium]|nr:aminopeptidase P N-terminal domain-containing protein [Bacteroidales bacterium]
MFSAQTYKERRERFRKQLDGGILLFLGNGEVGMNYADNTYPFRQDSTFLYYFGLDYAGLSAIMDLDSGEDIIFGDELTIDDIVWTGTMPTLAQNALLSGVGKTLPSGELRPLLEKASAQGRSIRFLPPYRGEHSVKLLELLG